MADRSSLRSCLRALVCSGALLLAGAGCARSQAPARPTYPAESRSNERQLSRERAALQRVLAAPESGDRLAALERASLDSFLPHPDRAAALEALLRQDETAAEAVAGQLLNKLPASAWADGICDLAARHGWRSCTGALVGRAFRQRDPLLVAPDAAALTALKALAQVLGTEEVAEALWQVVAAGDEEAVPRAQAWELYVAVVGVDAARNQLLAAAIEPVGLLADLRVCATDLQLAPVTLDEIVIVRTLLAQRQSGDGEAVWEAWSRLSASLTPAQRRGLTLRHFPVLQTASGGQPDLMMRSLEELLAALRSFLLTTNPIPPQERSQVVTDVPDVLSFWGDELAWGDLVSLVLLVGAVADDPTLRAALREQVELDLGDDAHEFGGLIRQAPPHGARRGPLLLEPYTSGSASLGDVAFHPPAEMRAQSPLAIAQYHLHAQERDSRINAGPGRGDLRYAARTGSLCLLVTPCGRPGLNLDCFARLHSGRVFILDLGTIAAEEP